MCELPTLRACTQDAEGRQLVLLFGGRRDDGLLLNDVWQGVLDASGGNLTIAWTLVHDPQAGVGQGEAAGHGWGTVDLGRVRALGALPCVDLV